MEIFIDGASLGNPGPAGAGVVFFDEAKRPVKELSFHLGETTNNVAEYFALIHALQEAQAQGLKAVVIKTDSELLAKQMSGEYRVRNNELLRLYGLARHQLAAFDSYVITHVPREQNTAADRLAGLAAKGKPGA